MGKPTQVRILTDTTSVLPQDFIDAHQLQVIPQVIIFGEETFLENVEISFTEFIQRLKDSDESPKTAAPPISAAEEALQRLTVEAETVICLHPAQEVSGTVRTVENAIQARFPDADVRVIDTRIVAGNLGAMVMEALNMAEAGVSADEIEGRIRDMIPRSKTYFLVDTLEYLHRGGRIGGASSLLGTALRIKPILHMTDGRIGVLEKVRTRHRALERLKQLVISECPATEDAHLCVMQADAEDRATDLASALQEALDISKVPVYQLGASITTHAGPGTLAVGFFV